MAVCSAVAACAAGCASGTSHIEKIADQVHLFDVALVGAAAALTWFGMETDAGWSTQVANGGEGRYRIAVVRWPGYGGGEGEFALRFGREARRVVAERACGGYRVLSYHERQDTKLVGSSRVAEGEIECR